MSQTVSKGYQSGLVYHGWYIGVTIEFSMNKSSGIKIL